MNRIRPYLLPLYAVATLFPRLLSVPAPFGQVQLTELLFFPLLLVFWKELTRTYRHFPLFTWSLTAYVAANLLSSIWAVHAGTLLEGAARGYLGLIALFTIIHCFHYGTDRLLAWWKWTTVGVAAGSLLGYGWLVLGGADPARMVSYVAEYPYMGAVYRLRGPANVYGMLYMLLLPGLCFAYHDWRRGRAAAWPWLLIAAAGLLTFGKENLLFPAGVCWYEASRSTHYRPWLPAVGVGLIAVLLFGTHFLVERTGNELRTPGYAAGAAIPLTATYHLRQTNYTINKRAALVIGQRNPVLGVGPGRFAASTPALVAEGRYPAYFGRFDPHSTWLGAFAETGALGLLSLLLFVGVIWRSGPGGALGPVGILLLLFLVASVFKDVANFRGLWVLAGMYLAGGLTPPRATTCGPAQGN